MRLLPLFLMLTLAASGCGITESKKINYKSAEKLPTLEVPPDLVAPTADNRYAIPDTEGSGSATLSAYSQERKAEPSAAPALLPTQEKARIERAGSQRWLVVQATPQQVWPVIKDFWQETGFIVNLESPETGLMETDWAENRANIPQDVIRRTLGKVLDGTVEGAQVGLAGTLAGGCGGRVEDRDSDSNKNTDNENDDHELYEGEALILLEHPHRCSPPFHLRTVSMRSQLRVSASSART